MDDKHLYVNIPPRHFKPLEVGDQFFHRVRVIEYVDNPLMGSHEKICTYSLGYAIKKVINPKEPFIALITVIQCERASGYQDYDANAEFHTQRGRQFYADGTLRCNLPNIGDEFKVIDRVSEYDLVKGYIYSLHRY